MTDPSTPDARLDRDLIALLDDALTMVATHFTPEQRAQLRDRAAGKAGLDGYVERRCSPEAQRVLLDRPDAGQVNPDGGRVGHVGEATGEPAPSKDGATVADGSARISATPTA